MQTANYRINTIRRYDDTIIRKTEMTMARAGITYDQVARAAEEMKSAKENPTLKAIRDRLGSGGMGTIHKHLTAWSENQPKAPPVPVAIPESIARDLNVWVQAAANVSRAEADERAAEMKAVAEALTKENEQLEADRDALHLQIAALTTERDQEQALAQARAAEVERLTRDLERERDLAGKAQIEAAQAKLSLTTQQDQFAETKKSLTELTSIAEAERKARISAEKNAAVLEAERDAARKDAGRIAGLQEHLDAAHAKGERLQAEFDQRLSIERAGAEKVAAEAKAVAVSNADLKARLEAAEKIIARLDPPKDTLAPKK
jgi:colicin import membrane protein